MRYLEPLADVRAHHWVDAPPSSGLTMACLRARVHRRGGEHCQPWRFGPQAHTGERWSGCFTSTAAPTFLAAVTRGPSASTATRSLPARRRWLHSRMKRGKVHETLAHSIPSYYFLPRLDLCTSLANLIPLIELNID
jgi:hypothetical protein